jgi:hypothetical protein
MEDRHPVGGEGSGPARSLVHWASGVTVAALVLADQLGEVLPALAAAAGAAWVLGLERRRPGG